MKKRILIAIGVTLLTLFSPGGLSAGANTVTFFVAPNGDDKNIGTKEQPFASLDRALTASRKIGLTPSRRIVVFGGKYYNVSLVLDARDSGLSIMAEPGETPILYGGVRITGWEKDGNNFFAAKLPGVKERSWDFRSLTIDGELRPRSRLPRTGEFNHLNIFDAQWHNTVNGGFQGADKPERKLSIQYRQGDLGSWLDLNNAELSIYHQWDDSVVGLKSHDPETQTLYFSNPSGYPPGAFGIRTYVLWNTREGMLAPGQWYLDRTRGMVVYWPKPGEKLGKIEAIAPTAETIININGTKNKPVFGITLEGLYLSNTTTPLLAGGWAAGFFRGAVETSFIRGCTFNHLHISGVGGQAIRMADGSNNTVTECEITNVGAGGIYDIRGNGNHITNNRINGFGRIYASAIGIRTPGGGQEHPELSNENEISNNEVSDGPYVGIEFEGWKNRFERNLVYNVMNVLRDGAALYGSGKNNVIRGNVVRDIPSGKQAHAYYIDELGHGLLVENNFSINCEEPMLMHMVNGSTIRNNVFINSGIVTLLFPKSNEVIMERNIIVSDGKIQVENPIGVSLWKNNLFFSRTGQYTGVPEIVQKGDPVFVDPAKMDYRFQANSSALKLGIRPLNFSNVGPQQKTRNDLDEK